MCGRCYNEMVRIRYRIKKCSDVCFKSYPSINIREIWNKGFIKSKHMDILRQISMSNKIYEINEYMLSLPRFLAKGLIYSFLFSSPACQDLSVLPNPSLLPASSGSSYSFLFSFTSGCPLYPCPRLCFAPFPG